MRFQSVGLFLLACLAPGTLLTDALTIADRLRSQEAIERVYYAHRLWPSDNPDPKPPFEAIFSRAELESRVSDYLKVSSALDEFWQRPLTGEQLQAEMDRMAAQTKDPKILRELFAVLGDNPALVAECLARPVLAERLAREWLAFDDRFQSAARAEAERVRSMITPWNAASLGAGAPRKVALHRLTPDHSPRQSSSVLDLPPDEFNQWVERFPSAQDGTRMEETPYSFEFLITLHKEEELMEGEILSLPKVDFDAWRDGLAMVTLHAGTEPPDGGYRLPMVGGGLKAYGGPPAHPDGWLNLWYGPEGRWGHTTVWTGSEMIIWGGASASTGARYNPATSSWMPTSTLGAPSARAGHVAVWSGQDMIVWGGYSSATGGYVDDGGHYNPSTDSWSPTGQLGSLPEGRSNATAVWTGKEMIICGGGDGNTGYFSGGSRYNPANLTWTSLPLTGAPSARSGHSAVWTGDRMIIWGGGQYDNQLFFNDGAIYNPTTNVWTVCPGDNDMNPQPAPRQGHTAVWTGERMIIWGGASGSWLNTGGMLDLSTGFWDSTPTTGAPAARWYHTAVWTGYYMVVWGGGGSGSTYLNTGGRFDPIAQTWVSTTTTNAPAGRYYHTAIWTGQEMIVWGGVAAGAGYGSGGRYNPTTNSWVSMAAPSIPTSRSYHSAVWTGSEMIIWGGETNTGGRYAPATDTWVSTTTTGAPTLRHLHTAVWTGTEMIVWGGTTDGSTGLNTGGRFTPGAVGTAGTWGTAPTTTGAPTARYGHAAAWAGTQMVVWGGNGYLNTGGRYTPSSNTWVTTTTSGAPAGRNEFSSVWTGTELIVWGGYTGFAVVTNTGGRYNPSTNFWTTITTVGAPVGRANPAAAWTGTKMVVWSGNNSGSYADTGGSYTPASNTWSALPLSGAPTKRFGSLGVWTGREVVFWGGYGCEDAGCTRYGGLSTGGVWDPTLGSWRPTTLENAPGGRYKHTWIWTGSAAIAWDGNGIQSGGVYYSNSVPTASFTVDSGWSPARTAIFDPVLQTPQCGSPASSCDSGNLLTGRDGMGPEPNQPNTINDSCADGTGGTFHMDESLDRLVVRTLDDSSFRPGASIVIEATVWAYAGFSSDRLDLYYTSNATLTPTWTYLTTITPTAAGAQILSTTTAIPPAGGTLHAVRGVFRYGGSASSCVAGSFNDHDDLVFFVGTDNVFTLGVGDSLLLNAGLSKTGSNPTTSPANTDPYDSLVSYEWDLNGDADLIATCQTATSGIDLVTATATLTEPDITALGLDTLSDHPVSLRVRDEGGLASCTSMDFFVEDGTPPTVALGSPNGGESWAFSESPSNRQSHLVVWNGADNFPPLARIKLSYSADGGSSWACIADTTGADCPSAGLIVTANAYLWSMPTQSEAAAAGQTLPTASGRVKAEVWDSSSNTASDGSDNNLYFIQPTTTAIKTLILWSPDRIESAYGTAAKDSLSLKLAELAGHAKVAGVVLNLAAVPAVQAAYAAWDAAPTNTALANAAAAQVRDYLLNQANGTYTNTQFVILTGGDAQIPFFRMADGTSIYSESAYPAEVGLSTATTIGAAIQQNYFLTDGYYAELAPEATGLLAPHDKAYLNDFAAGRLVETPAQMEALINAFIVQDGQVNASAAGDEVLVTGFDFLHDSARDIRDAWAAAGRTTDALLDDPGFAGDEYTSAQLKTQLFTSPPVHKVANINTHANHYSWAVSSGALTTTQMEQNPTGDLTGTVLYTSGCHSGLPVPSTDPNPLDLPEAMAKKKVLAYIGNTGYGWGLNEGKGLTEALMEGITAELIAGGSLSLGKALANAKRSYFMGQNRYDVFDEKVLHELTLFGIPNTLVVTQPPGYADPPKEELPPPDGPDKGCADGICLTKSLTAQSGLLPSGVTALNLNFTFGPGTYIKVTTAGGDYYKLNNRSSSEVGDAIQPHFVYNSYLSGTLAHGILFDGGVYTAEGPFDPVISVPQSTNYQPGGEGPLPAGSMFTPSLRASFGTAGGLGFRAIGQVGYTNMTVPTGFYDALAQTESRFADMQFIIYYSISPDVQSPFITDPGAGGFHILSGLSAAFSATVFDASGIFRTVVVYNDLRLGRWASFDLAYNGASGKWEGTLPLKGSITYYLQSVDNAGNVGILPISNGDLDPYGQPYGSTWTGPKSFSIALPDTDADGLPNAYEALHGCLDPALPDAGADPDSDLLTAAQEFALDTDPCKGDTDGGGDNDGSERNNGRNPLAGGDDKHLTIFVAKNGNDYQVTWPGGSGDNASIGGAYFVYRSDTPFFDPADLVNGTPVPDGTAAYFDVAPACAVCYYNVWNYALETPPPAVDAVVPAAGPAAGGTAVKVYGSAFTAGAAVIFGTIPATGVTVVNSSQIQCTTPPHAPGSVTVKVVNPNGQEGTLPNGFTYQ